MPLAFTMMAMHSLSHHATEVHGLLLGHTKGNKVFVSSANPICHESPTKPLVEAALAVTLSSTEVDSSSSPVGWYSIPALEGKLTPSVLRIVAGLEGIAANPVLVTMSKLSVLSAISMAEGSSTDLVQAFGKDFGGQYLEKLRAVVSSEQKTLKVLEDLAQHESICDLVDHWRSPKTEWPNTSKINKHLQLCVD